MSAPVLFLDFETFFSDEYSLKKMSTQEYILDERFHVHGAAVCALDSPYPIWLEGDALTTFIKAQVPKCILVGHNLKFDGGILAWHYGAYPVQYQDTLAFSRALNGARLKSHSLDSISQDADDEGKGKFLTAVKGVRILNEQQRRVLKTGCINDVALTRRRYLELRPHMPEKELEVVDWTIRIFTQPKLILNTEKLAAYYNKVLDDKETALARAGLTSRDMLMSNPQFAQALIDRGVDPPMKISPATGKESYAFAKTDEAFKELLEHEDPDVQTLVAARLSVKSTIEETRAAGYWRSSQLGPWPVDLNYSGAEHTHRMSGGPGGGGNPQNLKRKGVLRSCIEAPPGFAIITGDLRQVELRTTFKLAGENEPLERLQAGEDLYSWFAGLMYGKPVEAIDRDGLERQIAKSAVLGLGFGMGWKTFYKYCRGLGIKITEEEARLAVDLYRNTFPRVCRLWLQCEKVLPAMFYDTEDYWFPQAAPLLKVEPPSYKCGSSGIRLPSGLHLKYHALTKMSSGAWMYSRKGMMPTIFGSEITANIVQALAAEIFKEKLMQLHKILWCPLAVHDEAVALCPIDKVEIGKAIVQKIMSASPKWWPDLPLDTEVKSSLTYGGAK